MLPSRVAGYKKVGPDRPLGKLPSPEPYQDIPNIRVTCTHSFLSFDHCCLPSFLHRSSWYLRFPPSFSLVFPSPLPTLHKITSSSTTQQCTSLSTLITAHPPLRQSIIERPPSTPDSFLGPSSRRCASSESRLGFISMANARSLRRDVTVPRPPLVSSVIASIVESFSLSVLPSLSPSQARRRYHDVPLQTSHTEHGHVPSSSRVQFHSTSKVPLRRGHPIGPTPVEVSWSTMSHAVAELIVTTCTKYCPKPPRLPDTPWKPFVATPRTHGLHCKKLRSKSMSPRARFGPIWNIHHCRRFRYPNRRRGRQTGILVSTPPTRHPNMPSRPLRLDPRTLAAPTLLTIEKSNTLTNVCLGKEQTGTHTQRIRQRDSAILSRTMSVHKRIWTR